MGTWGFALYDSDLALDIRNAYIDKIRHGKSNKTATYELIDAHQENIEALEYSPLFWLVLADTQWDYGRLLPEIKEKALCHLSIDSQSECWDNPSRAQQQVWMQTLNQLKDKLNSPQPKVKRISKRRLYQCNWNLGDVFAYRFSSEYSAKKGFAGKYAVFRKISEDTWWPGHIIPVVQIYNWVGDTIPPIAQLCSLDFLPAFYKPSPSERATGKILKSKIKLISESAQKIPIENLSFLGNLPGDDLVSFQGHDYWTGYFAIGWEKSKYNVTIEQYIIDMYLALKDKN